MNLNNSFIFLLFVLLSSCQKDPPYAYFTTDKKEYNAGETVHLTDASTNAYHWKWTLPDGTGSKERNVDYVIDVNKLAPYEFVTLEVVSKNHLKKSTTMLPIKIYQAILPTDYFCHDIDCKGATTPYRKSANSDGSNWIISAMKYPNFNYGGNNYISIYLGGANRPVVSGTYSLQDNHSALLASQASVIIEYWGLEDEHTTYTSLSGEIQITVDSFGKVNASFDKVEAKCEIWRHPPATITVISGNITCY